MDQGGKFGDQKHKNAVKTATKNRQGKRLGKSVAE